jgi:hypothetical protein
MFSRSFLIASVLGAALLLTGQNAAEAGFLLAGPRPAQGLNDSTFAVAFPGLLDEGAGAGAAEQSDASNPDLAVAALNAALSLSAGAFAAGGMNSSAPEVDGQTIPGVADVPTITPTDVPMVAWVGAEGSASLPPPLSTGILRPPRPRMAG